MTKLFSLSDLQKDLQKNAPDSSDRTEILRTKFVQKHLTKINNLKELMGNFPSPGETIFLFTLKSFNAFTFIVYIIHHIGSIDELTFSTYGLNDRILTSLLKWYDKGEIKKVNISISDSIKHRVPKVFDTLEKQNGKREINIRYCWNHSKITLIKCANNYFVIEGSGNFSENALHEQYIFMNDQEIYNFRRSCIFPM
ncbi:MAG: hypothetical protein JXR07_20275 [Reichenbachiella sp.]